MKRKAIISIPHPHVVWPPLPDQQELKDLVHQRENDISIKGKSGPIKQLEELFLAFLENSRKYCISFNSGTSALLAAYFALDLKEGDEVIGPALTFHAALSPMFMLKLNPVLVDVEKGSRCIDPKKIEKAITKKTKAITVVHQWGHPANMDPILKIAKKYNLKVIEDCSHAHGSRYKQKQVGTFGDIAVFSMQAAKLLYAGEGGLLVTNNNVYHDRATLLGHYRDRSRDEIKEPFYQSFWVSGYGLKLRMSPYNAVTAIHALKKLPDRISSRKKCLYYFMEGLKKIPEIENPIIASWADMGAWYGFKPLLNLNKIRVTREEYIEFLQNEGMDIDVPSAPVLTQLPLYNLKNNHMFADIPNRKIQKDADFPIAVELSMRGLSLPTFTDWKISKPIIDQYILAFEKASSAFSK